MNICIPIIILLTTALLPDANACFSDIPLSNVVESSSTVLIGKIESIETNAYSSISDSSYTYDIAHIRVRDVLKNTQTNANVEVGHTIPLSMPSAKMEMRNSKAFNFQLGQDGVWILDFNNGYFWATYPKDYQPLNKSTTVRQIIFNHNGVQQAVPGYPPQGVGSPEP